mgnify:CR=1 FL=1
MTTDSKSQERKSVSASQKPRNTVGGPTHFMQAWSADVITLFPDAFPGVLGHSLIGRALVEGKWLLNTVDLRKFGEGKHKSVDDKPAGGGAGMVLRADIVGKAIEKVFKERGKRRPLICLSPRGRPFEQALAQKWVKAPGIILLAGRFEGLDQRVIDYYGMEEVSLGDFVMSGGEIAAQAMIDACVRLLPAVLGNPLSIEEESHATGLLEYPQYTRPKEWKGKLIPKILQSGNHKKIADWRRDQAETLTRSRRPDLWKKEN